MKRKTRNIIEIILLVAMLSILVSMLVFSNSRRKIHLLEACEINLKKASRPNLSKDDIESYLERLKIETQNVPVDSIDPRHIEYMLSQSPYIEDVQVYITNGGLLRIDVSQKTPFLRVYAPNAFYITEKAESIPINTKFPQRLRVASIEGENTEAVLKIASSIEKLLQKSELLSALIEQIHIDKKGEIELVPKVGDQRIFLGRFERMEEKLENLVLFYKKAIPQCGWDRYESINLKYRGQIVCTKR